MVVRLRNPGCPTKKEINCPIALFFDLNTLDMILKEAGNFPHGAEEDLQLRILPMPFELQPTIGGRDNVR
jgi:hypothetical protein